MNDSPTSKERSLRDKLFDEWSAAPNDKGYEHWLEVEVLKLRAAPEPAESPTAVVIRLDSRDPDFEQQWFAADRTLKRLRAALTKTATPIADEALSGIIAAERAAGETSAAEPVRCKATAYVQGETKRCEFGSEHDGEHIVQRRGTTPFRWRT